MPVLDPNHPHPVLSAALLALALGGSACAHTAAHPPTREHLAVTQLDRVVADASTPVGITELERAFERSAEIISPSVVSITSERAAAVADVPAFLRPFGAPDHTLRGLGSGVVVDVRGYILTNNHVVDGAERLRVKLPDDRELDATVVGTDPKTDLAVVKIDADDLVAAITADSDKVRVGQWVIAAGSPFGLTKSVTAGIVSAVGRGGMGITDYGDFIQTDAAINQGNSGGPLIDLQGPCGRHQHRDRVADRRQQRHRLRDPDRSRQGRGGAAHRARLGRARLDRHRDGQAHPRDVDLVRLCAAAMACWSTTSTRAGPEPRRGCAPVTSSPRSTASRCATWSRYETVSRNADPARM